jgi:hypothetical protein
MGGQDGARWLVSEHESACHYAASPIPPTP